VTGYLPCTDTKLRQLVRLMGRHYDAELRKVGMGMTQFWVLTQILEHGPARPCDLAKAMALEPCTLTRTLKPLIATGWLESVAGADRRTRSVRITRSGRMKRAEGLRRWQSADMRVRELLGAQNAKRLDAVLDDSLEAVPAAG
jgi:DNA-binding MarR family transcriptional regulator